MLSAGAWKKTFLPSSGITHRPLEVDLVLADDAKSALSAIGCRLAFLHQVRFPDYDGRDAAGDSYGEIAVDATHLCIRIHVESLCMG